LLNFGHFYAIFAIGARIPMFCGILQLFMLNLGALIGFLAKIISSSGGAA
jgi:hypothetical protein